MISLPKPEVILTHESDLDGLVSGLLLQRLARHLFGETIPLEAYHYHAWRLREPTENQAWVADFAFEPRLDKPNWVIIDHHTTEHAPQRAQLIHDPGKSAGRLCYELCLSRGLGTPILDRIVHLNDVADLFLEEDPDFIVAGDYANLVKVYHFWNLHALVEADLEALVDHPLLNVIATKRTIEDPIGLAWSRVNTVALSPTVGLVNTVVGNTNLIVYQILESDENPYPVLMTLYRRPNGIVAASIRSRNGEALKVAEKLQGGGHPNACGATMPRSIRNIPDAIAYLQQVLDPGRSGGESPNSLESLFEAIEKK